MKLRERRCTIIDIKQPESPWACSCFSWVIFLLFIPPKKQDNKPPAEALLLTNAHTLWITSTTITHTSVLQLKWESSHVHSNQFRRSGCKELPKQSGVNTLLLFCLGSRKNVINFKVWVVQHPKWSRYVLRMQGISTTHEETASRIRSLLQSHSQDCSCQRHQKAQVLWRTTIHEWKRNCSPLVQLCLHCI